MTQQAISEAVQHIKDHGYFIAKGAIDHSLCDALLDEIHRLEELGVPRSLDNNFHGHRTTRFYDVLNLGNVWQQLPVHPAILPVVRDVLARMGTFLPRYIHKLIVNYFGIRF